VRRSITGFHQDEGGDWVAQLSCLHAQHVHHDPPFWDRPWVKDQSGRDEHVGTGIDCPLCDRAELPDGLRLARTAGPFDADSLPAALRRRHLVADHTWGYVRVIDGSVGLVMATEPPIDVRLGAGEGQAIPPGVAHHLVIEGPVSVAVDFLVP
jgi:tellurite resistance-related uncharacterized protein